MQASAETLDEMTPSNERVCPSIDAADSLAGTDEASCAPAPPPITPRRTPLHRRRYIRSRPLDVNKWDCRHVAQWLGEQRWNWKELPAYQARMCEVGVVGSLLYRIDDSDLRSDIQARALRSMLLD